MTRYVPAQDIINSAQGGISSHKIDPRSLKTPKFSRCADLRARFARPAARASLAQLSPRKKGLNHVPLAHPDRGSSLRLRRRLFFRRECERINDIVLKNSKRKLNTSLARLRCWPPKPHRSASAAMGSCMLDLRPARAAPPGPQAPPHLTQHRRLLTVPRGSTHTARTRPPPEARSRGCAARGRG